jgi:hypothetical protein
MVALVSMTASAFNTGGFTLANMGCTVLWSDRVTTQSLPDCESQPDQWCRAQPGKGAAVNFTVSPKGKSFEQFWPLHTD